MVRAAGVVFALLIPSVEAVKLATQDQQLSRKTRPVMKVVRMLQDMRTELQKSLDDDKAVHDNLHCWCTDNDKEKTAAIEAGESRENELEAFLGEATAKMGEIKVKRDDTHDEVDRDWSALNEASALRMKENQEFHGEETHLQDAIQALDQAITVLSKHHSDLAQVRSVAKRLRDVQVLTLGHGLPVASSIALRSFLDGAQGAQSFLAIPGYQSYAPQSGQIFGILKQMKEDFEKALAASQSNEVKEVGDFKEVKAAKEAEIDTGKKLVVHLEQQYAEVGEQKVQAAKELADVKAQLELDRTFLANLKKKCAESDAEFDARVQSRMQEISAVDDTIKILNDDEAFDNFDKTVNVALLQTSGGLSTAEQHARGQRAASLLATAAEQSHSPKLSLLATMLNLDAFTKVKEEIDKMVVQLEKQQKDEVAHRDWCVKELGVNNRSTEAGYDRKESLTTKIADLEKAIETMTQTIDATNADVAELQNQMKRASENREGENAVFQQTVSDQRLTQIILRKALSRMKEVYNFLQDEPQPGAAHVALSGNHTDPGNGPNRFTKYEQHAGGNRVVAALEDIIATSETAENQAMTDEEDAQSAYEYFMKQSNDEIILASKKVSDLSEARAKAKEDLSMAETDFKQTMDELEELNDTFGRLKKSCDFVMDNFEARQAARSAEMDALKEAKAILSGMS